MKKGMRERQPICCKQIRFAYKIIAMIMSTSETNAMKTSWSNTGNEYPVKEAAARCVCVSN